MNRSSRVALGHALSRDEREVILTLSDAEGEWCVYTDSQRLSGRLKKLAAAWGVIPNRLGEGWDFRLPLRAISFRKPKQPPTDRQRAAGRRLSAQSRSNDTAIS